MTSEILIMTPTAIALAADSVVTIGNSKTYDGANKLFMLSNNPPSGIMIYNNANFYNIPMETIIKDFRKKMRRENIGKIEDYKSKLEDYLKQIKEENQIQDIPLIELIKLFSNKLMKLNIKMRIILLKLLRIKSRFHKIFKRNLKIFF